VGNKNLNNIHQSMVGHHWKFQQLGANVILPSQQVCLLGVVVSTKLGNETNVSTINATYFYHLCHLWHI